MAQTFDEIVEEAAEHMCDMKLGAGTWRNPGTLPDELDKDEWRRIARFTLIRSGRSFTRLNQIVFELAAGDE